MRRAPVFIAIVVLSAVATADAQFVVGTPPAPGGRSRAAGPPGRPGVEAIVERLLAFDANDDQKVTKAELNERLQDLVGRGDADGDGALDSSEIRRLAADAVDPERRSFVAPPGPGAVRIVIRPPVPRGVEGLILDLKLLPDKREQALALIRPLAGESPLPPTDAVAAQVVDRLRPILGNEEFENFQAALDRLRRPPFARAPTASR
jgi:hypothetical protein